MNKISAEARPYRRAEPCPLPGQPERCKLPDCFCSKNGLKLVSEVWKFHINRSVIASGWPASCGSASICGTHFWRRLQWTHNARFPDIVWTEPIPEFQRMSHKRHFLHFPWVDWLRLSGRNCQRRTRGMALFVFIVNLLPSADCIKFNHVCFGTYKSPLQHAICSSPSRHQSLAKADLQRWMDEMDGQRWRLENHW